MNAKIKSYLYNVLTVVFAVLGFASVGSFDMGESFRAVASKTAIFVFLAYKSYVKYDIYYEAAQKCKRKSGGKIKVYHSKGDCKAA